MMRWVLLLGVFWFGASEVAEAKKKLRFGRHVWPTVRRYCVSCHRPKKMRKKKKKVVKPAAGGLDLRRKVAYKNLVNVQSKQGKEGYSLVTPGEPALSYILFKLQGNHKHPNIGGKGTRCPKKKRLAVWRINRITKWIQQGAKK